MKAQEISNKEIIGRVNLNVALEKQLSVLPNLYNVGFYHVLWVTGDVTQSGFGNMLGNGAVKRLKVPL